MPKTGIDAICTIANCSNPASRTGLCNAHYLRKRRHGDPLAGGPLRTKAPLKFYNEVVLKHEKKECLLWPYGTVMGYGSLVLDGRTHAVHRLVCIHFNGPPPSNKPYAAHNCGVRLCCAKFCLRWDSPKGNSADRLLHGTQLRGEDQPNSKLTTEDVIQIRSLRRSVTEDEIAQIFGVSRGTISCIMQRRTWAWLS
jgi:hypothetical protein